MKTISKTTWIMFGALIVIALVVGLNYQRGDDEKNPAPAGQRATKEEQSLTPVKIPLTHAPNFKGTTGEFIPLRDGKVSITAVGLLDGKVHYFNTQLPSGKWVFFFIVKSPDGRVRAAANGCQVCGRALMGFRQSGDSVVCNTCGNRYHLNRVATERGGCNPVPIDPDLLIIDSKIEIPQSKLKELERFF